MFFCVAVQVNYLDLSNIIKRQRAAVYEQIKKISNSHIVYPGLKVFAQLKKEQGEKKEEKQQESTAPTAPAAATSGGDAAMTDAAPATDASTAAPSASPTPAAAPAPLIAIADIPGVKESGWRPEPPSLGAAGGAASLATRTALAGSGASDLHAKMGLILKQIKGCKDHWPFLHPVDAKLVPDYYTIIAHPMDLETMNKKLNSFEYKTKEQFIQDATYMVRNCMTYNQPDTTYYRCAKTIEELIKKCAQQQFGMNL